MRLGSKWNRRNFLGSLGVIAGAIVAPLKLSAAKAATTSLWLWLFWKPLCRTWGENCH